MVGYLLCVLLGVVAGLSSGVFGIGGGIIIVPALMMMFKFTQKEAQGTSLASLLLPVGAFAVWNYHKSGNANLVFGACIALGYLGGAYSGSKFVLGVSNDSLRTGFGIFLMVVGLLLATKQI